MKKILFGVVFTLAAVSAQASYLYWQLDSTITMQNTGRQFDFKGGANYATVYAVDSTGNKTALYIGKLGSDGQYSSLGTTKVSGGKSEDDGKYLVNLQGMLSGYSYYVEYMGYDASYGITMVGTGSETKYTDLTASIVDYNSSGLSPIEQANIWHGGTANAPEPTSAMLMLLGVAGLALKRKQRKLA